MQEIKVKYADGSEIVIDLSTIDETTRTSNGVTLLSGGCPVCVIDEHNNGFGINSLVFTNNSEVFPHGGDATQDWIGIIIIIIGALLLL